MRRLISLLRSQESQGFPLGGVFCFALLCFLAGLRVAQTFPNCWGIRKIRGSPPDKHDCSWERAIRLYRWCYQAGRRIHHSQAFPLHSAEEVGRAVTNNPRLPLIVLITLSIAHVSVSQPVWVSLKFTLARILSLLDTSPGFSNSLKGAET